MQRTLEQLLAVLPKDAREGFVTLGREAHQVGARSGASARAAHVHKLREYLLSNVTNARYAMPTDAELDRMVETFFSASKT